MDALAAIAARQSTRSFTSTPVPREVLEKIVDCGRLAPTALNEQPWEMIVVTDPERLRGLGELANYGKFIAQAPACIAVFCANTKYYLEDGCNASENMLIAATALGLQSCWVAGDKKSYCTAVAKLLGVPDGLKLVSLLVLGYGEEHAERVVKRPLTEVLHWEKH